MRLNIEINLNNAAFDPYPPDEVERVLKNAAADFHKAFYSGHAPEGNWSKRLLDINGNTVGRMRLVVSE